MVHINSNSASELTATTGHQFTNCSKHSCVRGEPNWMETPWLDTDSMNLFVFLLLLHSTNPQKKSLLTTEYVINAYCGSS